MQQWEYLRVMWCGHNELFGRADNVIVSVSDGRLHGDKKNAYRLQPGQRESKLSVPEMDAMFSQLGVEGWELVNVCSDMQSLGSSGNVFTNGGCIAYFKRP